MSLGNTFVLLVALSRCYNQQSSLTWLSTNKRTVILVTEAWPKLSRWTWPIGDYRWTDGTCDPNWPKQRFGLSPKLCIYGYHRKYYCSIDETNDALWGNDAISLLSQKAYWYIVNKTQIDFGFRDLLIKADIVFVYLKRMDEKISQFTWNPPNRQCKLSPFQKLFAPGDGAWFEVASKTWLVAAVKESELPTMVWTCIDLLEFCSTTMLSTSFRIECMLCRRCTPSNVLQSFWVPSAKLNAA